MCFPTQYLMFFVNRDLAEVCIGLACDILHSHSHPTHLLLCTGSRLVSSGAQRAFFLPANGNSVHLERIFWEKYILALMFQPHPLVLISPEDIFLQFG